MIEPHELAEIYFNREPYPDFCFDLQMVTKLVAAQQIAAPHWANRNSDPGDMRDHVKCAIQMLGIMKDQLLELKNIRDGLDQSRKL